MREVAVQHNEPQRPVPMIHAFRKLRRWGALFVLRNRPLEAQDVVLESRGRCPTCTRDVKFVARTLGSEIIIFVQIAAASHGSVH